MDDRLQQRVKQVNMRRICGSAKLQIVFQIDFCRLGLLLDLGYVSRLFAAGSWKLVQGCSPLESASVSLLWKGSAGGECRAEDR